MKNSLFTVTFLAFAFSIFSSPVLAQKSKKKSNDLQGLKEIYYISKKTKLRNGAYFAIRKETGDTIVFGEFSNGIRTGVWTFFDFRTKKKSLQYNFYSDSLLFIDYQFYPDSFFVQQDSGYIYTAVDRPMIVIGYTEELRHQISQRLVYPGNLPKSGKNGSSTICFSVDENGKITGSKIIEGYNTRVEQRISAIVNQYNDRILPAVYNGKKVKSMFFVKANFYDYKTIIPQIECIDSHIFVVDFKFKMVERSHNVMHGYVFDTKRKSNKTVRKQ